MAQAAAEMITMLSQIPSVFKEVTMRAVSESSGLAAKRSLLDQDIGGGTNPDDEELMEFVLSFLPSLIIGIVLAVCVLVGYLLFILVSCCCKCCNSDKRGLCQRPQQLPYMKRLPFILMVVLPALLGLIGAVMVLSGGPGLIKAIQALIDVVVEQFNLILALLQSLYDDGTRASDLSGSDASVWEPLASILDTLTEFRDNGLEDFSEQTTFYFALVLKFSMVVSGVLMATAAMGIVGPLTLKNFFQVAFLMQGALLTPLPFVCWGVFSFAGNLTGEICNQIDLGITGVETTLPTTIPCPDIEDSREVIDEVLNLINGETATANGILSDATTAAADAFSALQTECEGFRGPGSTYYDALCTTPASVDAQLMTSIYKCADAANEDIPTFSMIGAIQNTDNSCNWHTSNYPSVDFGTVGSAASIEACFKTATQTINSADENFRGLVAAAQLEGGSLLQVEEFVTQSLQTLPLACSFDTGTNEIQFTSTPPPVLPSLCAPFELSGAFAVATDPAVCEAAGETVYANFRNAFKTFDCSTATDVTLSVTGDTDDDRKRCTIAARPMLPSEFTTMADSAEAITILQGMMPNINRLLDCSVIGQLMYAISTNCHPIAKAAKFIASGMLLCGIGFAVAALFVCACWRKLNKPKHSVEPYDDFTKA